MLWCCAVSAQFLYRATSSGQAIAQYAAVLDQWHTMNLLGVHSSPSCKTQPQVDSRQNGPRPNSHWGAIGLLLWDKTFLNCSTVWAHVNHCFTVWCHGEMQKKKKRRWKVYVQWHRNSDSVFFERIPLEVLSAASAAHLGKWTKKYHQAPCDLMQFNTATLQRYSPTNWTSLTVKAVKFKLVVLAARLLYSIVYVFVSSPCKFM